MKKQLTELDICQKDFTELSEKLKKLEVFLQSPLSESLEISYKNLLNDQQHAMKLYLEILAKRIDILRYNQIYR